jgi:hypothetical protein
MLIAIFGQHMSGRRRARRSAPTGAHSRRRGSPPWASIAQMLQMRYL